MKQNIFISDKHLNDVRNILKQYLPDNAVVWVFGSRAKGNGGNVKPFSDLDLAIAMSDGNKLDIKLIFALTQAFEESLLPWKVDIIDYHDITTEFQQIINEHRQRLYL